VQEKSFFLVKNQQVVSWKNGKGRGLTENARVIAWNYEENWPGSGDFFETPVSHGPRFGHLESAGLEDVECRLMLGRLGYRNSYYDSTLAKLVQYDS
jgi:hypothetical protein